jgi:hypothetical protein
MTFVEIRLPAVATAFIAPSSGQRLRARTQALEGEGSSDLAADDDG